MLVAELNPQSKWLITFEKIWKDYPNKTIWYVSSLCIDEIISNYLFSISTNTFATIMPKLWYCNLLMFYVCVNENRCALYDGQTNVVFTISANLSSK